MALSKKIKPTGFFVTGTDTGVGKTFVAQKLMQQLSAEGMRVVGFKPLASGAEKKGDSWWQEDVAALQAASNVSLPDRVVNPYCFEEPIAPAIAARQTGIHPTVDNLVSVFDSDIAPHVDAVVVEGAGGWVLSVNEHETLVDLAVALQLPVVLVVGIKLGCINHALLTEQSIRAANVPVAGWYANRIDPETLYPNEQIKEIQDRLSMPLLGDLSYDSACSNSLSTAAVSVDS